MNNAEKEAFSCVIKGMTEEEKRFALQFIPTEYMQEELQRKNDVVNETLSNVFDIVQSFKQDMTLNEAQSCIGKLRSVLRGE